MSYRVSTPDGNTQAFDTQAEADAREAEIRRGRDRAQVVGMGTTAPLHAVL